jgi:putative rhs element vgr protein
MIHELTHVWQYQQGFKTWLGGLFLFVSGGYRRRRAYLYPNLSDIYHFGMLNMEQQADLLAHYYASCYLKGNIYNAQNQTFQKILKSFIDDPCQKEWLPQCRFYRKNKRT